MIDLNIRTPRLSLRPFSKADAQRTGELCGAWAVARMLASVPFPLPAGLTDDWITKHDDARANGDDFPFAITLHNRLIGCISLGKDPGRGRIELGYWIAVSYWGFGYATEAARAILAFGFGWLGFAAVCARRFEENEASGRVLAKLGFLETGRSLHPCLARKAQLPGVELELTRDSWRAKQV